MSLADGSYWIYSYDSLGQLISGKRYWNDGTPVAGQQFEFVFDDIGNRENTKEGGDSLGAGLRTRGYTANAKNQSFRNVLNSFEVMGAADTGSVTVNGVPAYRRGSYFESVLTFDSSAGDVYGTATIVGGEQTITGKVFVPRYGNGTEDLQYDLDGNLYRDARWNYTWDSKNRLVVAESKSDAPVDSRRRIMTTITWAGESKTR